MNLWYKNLKYNMRNNITILTYDFCFYEARTINGNLISVTKYNRDAF